MPNQQVTQSGLGNELDRDVVNLAKAIRQVESNGNFSARGKSGEFGAYQYTPDTWNARARKYGVNVPLEQATPEQQNEVQYKWMKEKKDEGYDIGQIASMHNAGEGRPNAYKEGFRGVNQYGVEYDVPEYARKVAETYHQTKGSVSQSVPQLGGQYTPPPTINRAEPEPQQKIGGASLGSRFVEGAKNFIKGVEKPFVGVAAIPVQAAAKALGQPDPYATFAQETGMKDVTPLNVKQKAGDIAQVGSYFVPGAKLLSALAAGALQGGGQAASSGEGGLDIAGKSIVGAGLGGLGYGAAKLLGKGIEGTGKILSGKKEQEAVQGIKDAYSQALNLNATQRAYETRTGKDLADVLVRFKAPLGRNADGTIDASRAIPILQENLEPLNKEAQKILTNYADKQIDLIQAAMRAKEQITKLNMPASDRNEAFKLVNEYFQDEIQSNGRYVVPEIADQIKQAFWAKSFDKTRSNIQNFVPYQVGKSLQKTVEDAVGDSALREVNAFRGDLIDALRRVAKIDGVSKVRGGSLGHIMGGVQGAIAGAASGLGLPGAVLGDYLGTRAAEFLTNPATKIGIATAKSTASGAFPKLLGKTAKTVGGGISKAGTAFQKTPVPRIAGLVANLLSNPR